jgi:hypothetical protein
LESELRLICFFVVISPFQLLGDPNLEVVARPARIGEDSVCGLPGCSVSDRLFDMEYPTHLAGVYSQLQWDMFLGGINNILESTSSPDCPIMPVAFVPPFCCFVWWWRREKATDRIEAINALVADENEKIARVGLLWSEPKWIHSTTCGMKGAPTLKGSVVLQMDVARRTQFELDNPQTTQFLGSLLFERTEMAAASGHDVVSRNAFSGTYSKSGKSSMDADQSKLLQRQITLGRKSSRHHSTSEIQMTGDVASTAAAKQAAAAKWTQSTAQDEAAKRVFQPIVPGGDKSGPNLMTR